MQQLPFIFTQYLHPSDEKKSSAGLYKNTLELPQASFLLTSVSVACVRVCDPIFDSACMLIRSSYPTASDAAWRQTNRHKILLPFIPMKKQNHTILTFLPLSTNEHLMNIHAVKKNYIGKLFQGIKVVTSLY